MAVQSPRKLSIDSSWKILLIDGDEDDFIIIRDLLKETKGRKIELYWASTYEKGQTKLAEDHYDAVLVDNDLGARTGIELIPALNEQGCTAPLILFTGRGSYEEDIEAMRAGATLYISKNDLNTLSLERFIRYAIERKQAETALKESEEKFAKAFRANPAPQFITRQSDGVIVDLNESYERLLGYSRAELIGHETIKPNLYMNPQDRNVILETLKNEGRVSNREVVLLNKAGSPVSVIGSIEVLNIGGEAYLLSTLIDITERKQAEATRQKFLQRVQIILSILYGGILVLNNDNRVEFANQAFCDMFEYDIPPDALIGKHASEILESIAKVYAEPDQALARIREILANGQPMKGEEVPIHGGQMYLRDYIPIMIDGKIDGRVWSHNDITERKHVEISLRESEERERNRAHELAAVLDAVPAYIFITHDPNSSSMSGNRATQELLRNKPDDNISKSGPEPEIPRQFRAIRDGKEITNEEMPVQLAAAKCIHVEDCEFEVVFEDGSSRRLIGNAAPLFDEKKNPAGAVGAFIDITDLRRIEQETSERIAQMEVQRRLLEHREMERSEIARDLHDGPLQSLASLNFYLNSIKVALKKHGVDRYENIEIMEEGIRNLAGELRGVCNELRSPLGDRFGLCEAVQEHVDGFQERHPEIKLSLDMTKDPNKLPENIATALFRIYQEALNNVVRHSGATEISIQFAFDHQQILLEIRDNGKGFPSKVDWVELTRQGHFGLVGMKERAEAIGGVFLARSSPGTGTTIRVTVPIAN
jgi:PAS domain S-box-containing protein